MTQRTLETFPSLLSQRLESPLDTDKSAKQFSYKKTVAISLHNLETESKAEQTAFSSLEGMFER